MGYSTDFNGELKFTTDLTSNQLAKVKSFLGEDCRNHPEWNQTGLTYIDLELTKDFSGLQWDGSEKTYELVEKVNLLITEMKKEYPEFGLGGKILAQGEDNEDRWILTIENGIAVSKEIEIVGKDIECPNCGEHFSIEIEE
jgi:hypothetical protein